MPRRRKPSMNLSKNTDKERRIGVFMIRMTGELFCEIKIYWNTKTVRHWKEKALKQFVHSLPNVRNPSSLFHVFIHSDAFYLPHILSLIELPYYPHKLRWEIWPEGIEKP